jgi:ketosteroid isomerase-like protein
MSANDALAIANLKATYCCAADTSCSDEAAARAMFDGMLVDDFIGDYGFKVMHGAQEIVDFMIQAIGGGSAWMIHALGSPVIKVDGEYATGDWTIAVTARRKDGEVMVINGRYSDTFRRTDGGWQIASITFVRFE